MRDSEHHVGPLERLHCLKSVPSFHELPNLELAALAQHATETFFRKRRLLFREGEPVDAVHLVVEGRVRLLRGGKEVGFVGPGEGVGLLELLSGDSEGVLAVADTETLTLSFKRDLLFDILEDHFSILHHLVKDVCSLRLDQRDGDAASPRTSICEPGRTSSGVPPPHELDLAEKIIFLRRAFPFARSRIAEVAELARHAVEEHHEPGAELWAEGDESDFFLVVVRGTVACRRPEVTRRFGAKDSPGVLEALAARPRTTTAVAEDEPLQALRLDVEHLLDVFEDNFELVLEYLGDLAREILRARDVPAPALEASPARGRKATARHPRP